MSILIKGMEMPKNCWECPMVSGYEISDDVKALCSTVRCRLTNTKRPAGEAIAPDCPLIPVPPHGDLFDITKVKITPSDDEDIAYEIDFGNTIIPAEEGV